MRIDHVGIVVRSLQETIGVYKKLFGDTVKITTEEDSGWKTAIIRTEAGKIELMEPTEMDNAVGKFLEKRGEGIHHLAVEVGDIQELLDKAASLGLSLIDERARKGAEGKLIGFIHPRSFNGVLFEFCTPLPAKQEN